MTEEKKEKNLILLKKEYEKARKEFSLPDFKFMNENFEIENISISETELFLKIMRKHMTEKIFYILRSLEMFINPQNAPMFVFKILEAFNESDKELVKEVYRKLSRYEIEAFGLEAAYDEKKEAEFIKRFSEDWKSISDDLSKIYSSMKKGYDKISKKQSKSYLG